MTVVIQIINNAAGLPCPERGLFVASCDFEFGNGRGHMTATKDIDAAMQFESFADALAFYRTSPKCHPTRTTDGRPNRPLTAYTVAFIDRDHISER